ncbi:2-keto-3-deoxy-D-arabino-heptulosonate-7- phosphate synthase II [Serinicoccus hydrothermalis]|uniref:Phospho-2-dehydro-3-deoxyheptonate aldolase n=1 Tax=Serinicoccus hydrothermalis TaxID=1758689 RepID=A0A1B1N9V7_9MICO|nr:3-deoxy-7-phosphoheptulonate synthase class II [Serinicoccus hydrothermalis]ANS78206.1 2-keto-3-deoxy-D-arabino-heptulosonate-7- phosphate synthase II [Serinicoccus hydrothermalis]
MSTDLSGLATSGGHDIDWPDLPARQQPTWSDPAALDRTLSTLSTFPPLVFAGECDQLSQRMAAVAAGQAFTLQGGDCAETLADVTGPNIRDRIKTILQMAVVLTYGAGMPIVKVGRMAGQFAKPRSSDTETRDGVTLPAYRGDMVNGFEFTPEARRPDPERLLRCYHASSATLNLVRGFTSGGFADLRSVHAWDKGFLTGPAQARYEQMAGHIDRAVRFLEASGVADAEEMRRVEFYSAHEALVLDYERPMVRRDHRTGLLYDTSSHLVWVGERTRDLDGAHIDFVSRIQNPVAVKLGPGADRDTVLALMDRIDPERSPGRLTFITRMGAGRIRDVLPPLLTSLGEDAHRVAWVCDPMHGNTFTSPSGFKTRRFEDVVDEVRGFFEAHGEAGTHPGGIHVELTGNDVTECVGGTTPVDLDDLGLRYETLCDPRLNHQQSLELAFVVAEMLERGGR